jgi:D-arabinose 1-dehydrogenase-like Zn-dependent alcohol dehydrogenase
MALKGTGRLLHKEAIQTRLWSMKTMFLGFLMVFLFLAPLLSCVQGSHFIPLSCIGMPALGRAIIGLGGLGHMGVKIAHALGAEVTVLSHSLNKQEDGIRMGADHFFATSDSKTFAKLISRA